MWPRRPLHVFLRESVLYSIDVSCKIKQLLLYALLEVLLSKELCCEGLPNSTRSFLR